MSQNKLTRRAIVLREYLAFAARTHEAEALESDHFSDRYIVDFECVHSGRSAVVRSCWIVLRYEDLPR